MSKEIINIDAIILHHVDYKDNDVIVTALSTSGKLHSIYARGIKKLKSKNAAAIQPLMHSHLTLFKGSKQMDTLKHAQYIFNTVEVFNDYDKMLTAFILADMMRKQCEDQIGADPQLYMLLKNALTVLKTQSNTLVLAVYLAKLLQLNGQHLIVDGCGMCGKHHINYISIEHGGFVCHSCLKHNDVYQVSSDGLKLFRYINKVNIEKIDMINFVDDDVSNTLKIMVAFYEHYVGIKISNIEQFIKE